VQVLAKLQEVRQLPEQNGKDPMFSVSLEGFSPLARADLVSRLGIAEMTGQMVSAVVSTHWKGKGQRPVFYIDHVQPVSLGLR